MRTGAGPNARQPHHAITTAQSASAASVASACATRSGQPFNARARGSRTRAAGTGARDAPL